MDVGASGGDGWRCGGEGLVTGFADFVVHIGFERFDFFLVKQAFANEKERKFGNWVATRLFFALLGGLVEFFVVGKRMRVGANNVRVKQRGAAALADVVGGLFTGGVALRQGRSIDFGNMQARKVAH